LKSIAKEILEEAKRSKTTAREKMVALKREYSAL
jgi:predicted  nucleic acid-binding Zn-ribbon protein